MNSNDKYWCAFSRLTKVSSHFVNLLYNYFGSIEQAWKSELYDLWKIPELQKRSIEGFIQERKNINPDESIEYIRKRGIQFIHLEDDNYPYLLKNIYNPPIGLFMLGNLESCNLERTLAVVGSRKASENSKITLRRILSDFKNTDICIVSGMAEGIDTVAHKTALENGLKTIAVLGGGFDKLYPKSNKKLFEQIQNGNGVVMTEYWPDVDALSFHFPLRNRIVSGLSKGVLVAEATIKSGAMITAKLALEQCRELMCIPGLITNPNTEGIYKLIKTGASIVTGYKDILDALNWQIEKKDVTETFFDNNSKEGNIINLLRKDSLTMDELILKTNLNINDLMIILTKLELNGLVKQTDGGKYISEI